MGKGLKTDDVPKAKAVRVLQCSRCPGRSHLQDEERAQPQQEQGRGPQARFDPWSVECLFPESEELTEQRVAGMGQACCLSAEGKLSKWLPVQSHVGQQQSH